MQISKRAARRAPSSCCLEPASRYFRGEETPNRMSPKRESEISTDHWPAFSRRFRLFRWRKEVFSKSTASAGWWLAMCNSGAPSNHEITPLSYRCPGCRTAAQMRIAWPWWICPNCQARLIPADSPSSIGKAKQDPASDKELRIDPGVPDKPVPVPNAPPVVARPSESPPVQPQRP